jgi:hypothetical protein
MAISTEMGQQRGVKKKINIMLPRLRAVLQRIIVY